MYPFISLPRIVAVPTAFLVHFHHFFGSVLSLKYGCHEESLAEHILIIHIPHLFVSREVHDQSAHERRLPVRDLPRRRINVRQQRVTQTNHLLNGIVHGFALLSELVYFTGCIRSVGTHHRSKGTKLQPTHVQLLIKRILRSRPVVPTLIILPGKEATDVVVPMGHAAKREIQAGRHLFTQGLP